MRSQRNHAANDRPVTQVSVAAETRAAFDGLMTYCQTCAKPFWLFEKELLVRLAVLGCCLIRLFLTARHERLDVEPYLKDGVYRLGEKYAERTLKTYYGEVTYGRQYVQARWGRGGCFPLDVVLGLTRDRLTPWVMQWVARLATRMSFKAARMTCQAVLSWAPATETIEQVVLGMGREAAAFMRQQPAAAPQHPDGDVLVIEIDGKCPPTATEQELAKRRGKRQPRHKHACPCGCQRHRGRVRRELRGSKKRRKRGDKSKHGREAVVVVMYTLERGRDGQLHGPRNKKLYATFAGRKAAAQWAREQATQRGFGPDTTKTVQIVLDGAKSLKANLKPLFPKAIFTLDVCHVVEKLWALGRHYHQEGSAELATWVEELKELVYGGQTRTLLRRLCWLRDQVPLRGPGTKARRRADENDRLRAATSKDDALCPLDGPRLGDRHGPSGRSGAAPGGRAFGLLGHALAPRQGRSGAAPALHRIEWRLGQVRVLVPPPNANSPRQGETPQSPNEPAVTLAQGRLKTVLESQLHP